MKILLKEKGWSSGGHQYKWKGFKKLLFVDYLGFSFFLIFALVNTPTQATPKSQLTKL